MGELDDHPITALTLQHKHHQKRERIGAPSLKKKLNKHEREDLEAKDCGASLDAGRIDHGGRHPPDGDPRQRLLAGVQHVGAG